MYQIKSGSRTLYHPFSDEVVLESKTADELNTQGSMDMVIDDPDGTKVNLLDPVEVYDENGMTWRGRVLSIDSGMTDSRRDIHCEGALAFLCDTIVQPFTFRGRPNDYTNQSQQLVKGLFHCLIDNHNNQLPSGDPRRFEIGEITVSDPNNYIARSSETPLNTWECIQTRLIDTLGGYVWLSGDELNVINYTANFDDTAGQTVKFAENLVDLVQTGSADGVITALIPYGAKVSENPEPQGDGFTIWGANRVHLSNAVEYPAGVQKWGYIFGSNTWDDITLTANLETAATKFLQDNFLAHLETIEITAADLAEIDATIDKFRVGEYVRVICAPLQIDETMLIVRKETNLIDVSQTRISIGRPPLSITNMVGDKS